MAGSARRVTETDFVKNIGTDEIKACPFCGFDDVQFDEPSPDSFAIVCPECECTGPRAGTVTMTIKLWNDRT